MGHLCLLKQQYYIYQIEDKKLFGFLNFCKFSANIHMTWFPVNNFKTVKIVFKVATKSEKNVKKKSGS